MEAEEVLTEEESEALREEALDTGDSDEATAREGGVRDLHIDHWDRVTANRIPVLDAVNEQVAGAVADVWSQLTQRSIEVVAQPCEPMVWRAYTRNLEIPTSLNVCHIKVNGLRALITLKVDTVFAMVDQYFGGDGKLVPDTRPTPFTPMEIRLVGKFVAQLTERMKEIWRGYCDLDFQPLAMATNVESAAIVGNSDFIFPTRFAFELAEEQHVIDVVLPAALIEPLRYLQPVAQTSESKSQQRQWSSRIREDVQEAKILLRAVLGETIIRLGDLSKARVGDIIPTEPPGMVTIYAGNQRVLEGKFGTHKGRNAVKISKPTNRNVLGVNDG